MRIVVERQAPARYDIWFDSSVIDDIETNAEYSGYALIIEDGDPFSKALSSKKQEWNAMMQNELKSLDANNT